MPNNNKANVILHILGVVHSELRAREAEYKGKLSSSKPEEGGGLKDMALETTLNIVMFKKEDTLLLGQRILLVSYIILLLEKKVL